MGTCLIETMISELNLEGRAGVSPGDTWGRAFLAEGSARAKAKCAAWNSNEARAVGVACVKGGQRTWSIVDTWDFPLRNMGSHYSVLSRDVAGSNSTASCMTGDSSTMTQKAQQASGYPGGSLTLSKRPGRVPQRRWHLTMAKRKDSRREKAEQRQSSLKGQTVLGKSCMWHRSAAQALRWETWTVTRSVEGRTWRASNAGQSILEFNLKTMGRAGGAVLSAYCLPSLEVVFSRPRIKTERPGLDSSSSTEGRWAFPSLGFNFPRC